MFDEYSMLTLNNQETNIISTRIHFQVLVKRAWLDVTWEISIMQVPQSGHLSSTARSIWIMRG